MSVCLQVVVKQELDNSRALLEEQLSSPGIIACVECHVYSDNVIDLS